MAIEHPALAGRERLTSAVSELLTELDAGATDWENDALPAFLEAFGALLGSIENSYINTGRPVPDDAWAVVADVLRGARFYE